MKKIHFFLSTLLMVFFPLAHAAQVQARFTLKNSWQRVETKHTIIQYQSSEYLVDFDDTINYSPMDSRLETFFPTATRTIR